MLEVVQPSDFYLDSENLTWVDNAFYSQSPYWIRSVGTAEQQCYVTKEAGEIIAYSFVGFKHFPLGIGKVAVIERGPVARDLRSLEKHIQALAQQKRWIQVEISPYNTHLDRQAVQSVLHKNGWLARDFQRVIYLHTVIVDLLPEIDEIKRNLRRSLKTQINKATKSDIEIRVNLHADEAIEFHNEFALHQGIAPISEQEHRLINTAIEQKKKYCQVLTAWQDEKLIGAIILLGMGETILYQWGVSHRDEAYRKLPITHLLHWEAICLAKKLGFRRYDFGGYWMEKGDDNPINRFKTGFSKQIDALIGEYFYRTSPLRSKLYELIIKRNA
ncbi:lipid II:glycine glycyltransferase FemX [Aliikangiella maris]|uniref:Peptidoglycan bridge formation glycyltransferase FemA/FemB family protein n=2 Tax=Aliikangiella maris TaxID=3162458 RepID=A0ABV2BXX1_9GAMM